MGAVFSGKTRNTVVWNFYANLKKTPETRNKLEKAG